MSQDTGADSAYAWEQACTALLHTALKQEHRNASLNLCTFWQQSAINKLSRQFAVADSFMAQHKRLARADATWALYQYLTCDILSGMHLTVNKALLLEVQVLATRMFASGIPYPDTLPQAYDSLAFAVDNCAHEALALEAVEREAKAECAALADENARLEERLRALEAAAAARDSSELVHVRRVPVASAGGGAAAIHIGN